MGKDSFDCGNTRPCGSWINSQAGMVGTSLESFGLTSEDVPKDTEERLTVSTRQCATGAVVVSQAPIVCEEDLDTLMKLPVVRPDCDIVFPPDKSLHDLFFELDWGRDFDPEMLR